jgi:acylphosphatase
MTRHLNIRINGKVQGVFFRASAKDQADKMGVKGFVRNEPDGGVYIEAEGIEANVKQFADWCKKGPARAQVMTIVIEESAEKGYVEFRISR